ncbi:hypothetical protein B1H18_13245 [Streptomyces tsukubensis]|uniref:Uncharacterized protein n=1 Tax=Streptomyces tsukubensis TaxID=83656 RepID=A0A1V4A9I0_9ACTN|nr:hypothetical protein B1H18_13245 [Streptomyces tsukubensis]
MVLVVLGAGERGGGGTPVLDDVRRERRRPGPGPAPVPVKVPVKGDPVVAELRSLAPKQGVPGSRRS